METSNKDYIESIMRAFCRFWDLHLGWRKKKEAKEAIVEFLPLPNPEGSIEEELSRFFSFLYDKFPDNKKELDRFRMEVNRTKEAREAGHFFTEDSYYTIKGIIENVKEYLSNFKGWEDGVCTYAEEAYDKDYFYFRFTTRVPHFEFGDYFDQCSIEFNKNAFFKDEKKILLDALTKKGVSGIRGSVKKELQEEVVKKLFDMLPEDYFTMDDLLVKAVEADETKEPTATPLDIVWGLIVQDIATVLEKYGAKLNHPACKKPAMIGESIDNMRDFLYDVNKAVQSSFNTFWTSTRILKILMRAKNEYGKRGWHPIVNNHGVLTMLDNNRACQLLYTGVKLIVDCLKDDICCVKVEHYPLGGALEFYVYPTTTKIDNNEDVKEFFWNISPPRDFSNNVQYLFNTFRPLIKEDKKDYFLKKWIDLFPGTEINEVINLSKI